MALPSDSIEVPPRGSALHTGEIDLIWRCTDCGYQRMGPEQPDGCRACGAPAAHVIGRTSIAWRMLLRRPAAH